MSMQSYVDDQVGVGK